MKSQHWIIAGVLVLAVLWLVWLVVQPPAPAVPVSDVTADDWVLGDRTSKTIVIEYSDFQCPACAIVYPWVQRVLEERGSEMAFAYRHFPLRSIHPNAEQASRAAEAAGQQGKFWEMHDLLFEGQREWAPSSNNATLFAGYAQQLGLNVDQFNSDRESTEVKQRVVRDITSGTAARVSGTPTFFVNGTRIDTPQNYEAFAKIISDAISSQP